MSDLLTERASAGVEAVASLGRLAIRVFVGWALARHVGVVDAIAIVFAFERFLGAHRARAGERP